MHKTSLEASTSNFFLSALWIFLKILLLVSVATTMWFETTSFVAMLWAWWVALWLALQWSLSNVAWWILILLFKPFSVGDYIHAQWEWWTVRMINILYTVLDTTQNQQVTIPNGILANNVIKNFSVHSQRMIEYTVPLAYDADVIQAKHIIRTTILAHAKVDLQRDVFVWVHDVANNAVTLVVKFRVSSSDYMEVYHDVLELLKQGLESKNITLQHAHMIVEQK